MVTCELCGTELHVGDYPFCHGDPTAHVSTKRIYIATDDIPGGMLVRHGICNPDGTPKRYYSKTEIKRAANEAGYTIHGDTPRPYNVNWQGRQRRRDGLKNAES